MLRQAVTDLLVRAVPIDAQQIDKLLEIPANEQFGDLAFPCFQLAKTLRKAPPVIASELAAALQDLLPSNPSIEKVTAVGGYLNFSFRRSAVGPQVVTQILNERERYAASSEGSGKKVAIDLSSPNIAKPFSIHHLRSTVIGNAIANIYESLGYDVIRINHIGDWGTSFGKLIVAYRLWGNEYDLSDDAIKQLLALYVRFNSEAENNPKLEDDARAAFKSLEDGDPDAVQIWKTFIEISLAEFQKIYDLLGISFTMFRGESFYNDKMDAVVDELQDKGLLVQSEGADVVELEDQNMPPCLIRKSDGATLYATRDLASAIYRHDELGADRLLYVVGAEQKLHFAQVFAVLAKMGREWADQCVHIPFGMLRFEGKKLSTRKGQVVFLEDVLNRAVEAAQEIIDEKNPDMENRDEVARAVGIGAIIFNDLKNNRQNDVTFTWEEALNFEGETGPYVQYTYARTSSLLRKAADRSAADGASLAVTEPTEFLNDPESVLVKSLTSTDPQTYTGDTEWGLIKLLGRLGNVIDRAKDNYDPSLVAKHVIDICQQFNRYYNATRILEGSSAEQAQKLALVAATRIIIRRCLRLLGLQALETI